MKRKPSGFIAICQCGVVVGALDINRTSHDEAGKLIGAWLSNGCTIRPQFGEWTVQIEMCQCK